MAKKDTKFSELPEEVTEEGLKIYGPASYETQVAILSHYLHNLDGRSYTEFDQDKSEIISAIRDYFYFKHQQDKKDPKWKDVSDEVVTMAAERPLECDLFADFFDVPFPAPENPKFTFIDLFAGIGGIRLGFEQAFGNNIETVFVSELDKFAQQTYKDNFGGDIHGDITKIEEKQIPKFDICLAGFPCQAFSIAGVGGNGREGFNDNFKGR